jgi:hypothetical protein
MNTIWKTIRTAAASVRVTIQHTIAVILLSIVYLFAVPLF